MSFSYDPTTTAGQVRLLITDTDSANALFSDEEITAFLALESGVVRRAAAMALDVTAASQTLLLKKITLLDLATDGPALGNALRTQATALREQEEVVGSFDWAEEITSEVGYRERIWNQALRRMI